MPGFNGLNDDEDFDNPLFTTQMDSGGGSGDEYRKYLMAQLAAAPKVESDNSSANNYQLAAALGNAANSAGTVGGRKADSSNLQNWADLMTKMNAQKQDKLEQSNIKRESLLSKIALLKDKATETAAQRSATQNATIAANKEKFANQKELENLKFQNEQKLAETKTQNKATVGQDALDKKFAADYNDFVNLGGAADLNSNIDSVNSVANSLRTNDSLTGGFAGRLPDSIRSITNPEAVDVRQNLESVVQRSLKQILGTQYTEREGKDIVSRAYNPTLPPEVNAARVEKLGRNLKAMADAKINASKYFEENGTLGGYKGLDVNDIRKNLASDLDSIKAQPKSGGRDAMASEAPANGPRVGDVIKGYKFKGGDPANKASWEKVE